MMQTNILATHQFCSTSRSLK